MAIMIPSVISPDVKSNAEKHIFKWFQKAPGTEDWIILHSLGVSNHKKVIHGEVDFFALIPEMGIFALEVKGGRVRRQNGIWSFTDKYGHTDTKERGPFDQAWEGIYSLKESISKMLDNKHRGLKDVIFGIGVMFPDVEYSSIGVDAESWQIFDSSDGENVVAFISRISEGTKNTWKRTRGKIDKRNIPNVDDIKYLKDWAQKINVKERISSLNAAFHNAKFGQNVEGDLRPEFVLIHTFAHLLINQLSFDCGYGSSSIRERIYCEKSGNNFNMHGLLIYTASGDSEGSLGGLVRQGEHGRVEDTIVNAIKNALWCTSDPICIQSAGQGPESLNLAACHNCALLPETCCEHGNRLLDRGVVVGTLADNSIGFFSELRDI